MCDTCNENYENFVLLLALHAFLRGDDPEELEKTTISPVDEAHKEWVQKEKQKNLAEFRSWQERLKCRK